MNTMHAYMVWYADGSTYKGSTVEYFRTLPEFGIICIIEYLEEGKRVIHGNSEYYWFDPKINRIGKTLGKGMSSFVTACPPPPWVVSKRAPIDMIPDEEYNRIMKEAFDRKTID